MDAKEGVQRFLIGLLSVKETTYNATDTEKAIEIASAKSPSAAFNEAQQYCRFFKSSPIWALGFVKGTRWLAVLRRDLGEQGFKMYVETLRLQISLSSEQPSWQLADGTPVVDRKDSHFTSHAEEYPKLLAILSEALRKIDPQGRDFIAEEVDMGCVIGGSICVETRPGEVVTFAQRPNRPGLTRFVKNREPEPCKYLTVILKRAGEGKLYVLMTAFVGRRVPDEPWSEYATPQSVPFWNTHALIWGFGPIIPDTETNMCPW